MAAILQMTFPASIATLAQRQPLRWANVGSPTLGKRWFVSRPNGGTPTLCQHQPNVGTLTLGQRWHNVTPMVVCQRCTNIGPTEAALLAFCEGNPSVTDRLSVEQTVELSNHTKVIDVNVIFTCLKMWLFCFEDVQTDPNTMYKRIMACCWPAPSH